MVATFFLLASLATIGMPVAINDPMVRSLKIENTEDFMAPPLIRLGSKDSLRINFDIIGEDRDYLRYRLLHCNSDWTPSRLLEQEYLEGFNEAEVDDYGFSTNTFVHYVNYNIVIPSDKMQLTAGGNYILQVYNEENPDEILFQTGFFVSENIVPIGGEVTDNTDKGFNTLYQQLELTLGGGEIPGVNPWQDIKVYAVQNNDFRHPHLIRHPLRADGEKIIYSHNADLIFPAGNEYRRFETVRTDYSGMHVDSIIHTGNHYHAYLTPDLPLADREYSYDRTQHGRFKIDEYNSTDPDLGADYIVTRFTLRMPEQKGREVYVDGEFTNGVLNTGNRMRYNNEIKAYELDIPMKQGSYNYRYIIADAAGNEENPDGNHHETSNEYLVLVYISRPIDRSDRLVGTAVLQSTRPNS